MWTIKGHKSPPLHRPQTIILYVSCVCRVYRERVELVSVFCCNWFRARTQIYTILYYTILYMNELRGERNANCRFWFWSCDYKRFLPQRHGMSLDTTGRVERERERERPDSKHCHKDFKIDSNDNDFLSSSVCPPSLFLWVFLVWVYSWVHSHPVLVHKRSRPNCIWKVKACKYLPSEQIIHIIGIHICI